MTLFDDDKPKRRKPKRDELWDAAVELFYQSGVPAGQRAHVNRMVWDLRDMKATPEKLRRRADRYPEALPGCLCTLQAIVNHWDQLRPPKPKPAPGVDPENDAVYQRRLQAWRDF
jgi:hypothetical protein